MERARDGGPVALPKCTGPCVPQFKTIMKTKIRKDTAGNYLVSTHAEFLAAVDHQRQRQRAETYARKAWELDCKHKNVRADDDAWEIHRKG